MSDESELTGWLAWLAKFPDLVAVMAGLAASAASVTIRAASQREARPVGEALVDSGGTAALSFVTFEILFGLGMNVHFSFGAAGMIGALGWPFMQKYLVPIVVAAINRKLNG